MSPRSSWSRVRIGAVGAVMAASLLVSPTSSGAVTSPTIVDGSVEELPFPDLAINEFIDEKFSADLSTAVFTRDPAPLVGDAAPGAGLTMVLDLDSGEQRAIQAERGPGEQRAVQLDDDGSHALVEADWEGDGAGQADGGAIDLFLVDTATDELELITDGLSETDFVAIGMDRAGDTVVFRSGPINGPQQLHWWENGVITNVVPEGDWQSGLDMALSGDGSTLLYTSTADLQDTWHVRHLASGEESSVEVATPSSVVISDDGRVVAGADLEPTAQGRGIMIQLATIWRPADGEPARPLSGSTVVHLSGDGSVLYTFGAGGVRASSTNEQSEETSVLRTPGGVVSFGAVDSAGDRVIVRAEPRAMGLRPVSRSFVDSGGLEEPSRFFLIDRTGEPARPPGYSGSLGDQIERLYRAFFDRPGEPGGVAYWTGVRSRGDGYFDVSQHFTFSAEFLEGNGELDDEAFLELVYQNVLDRSPDAGGLAFWLEQLSDGRPRGEVMGLFSESPEFIDITGTLPPENAVAASVRRLYAGYFGRDADVAGLAHWIGQAEQGVPLAEISRRFLNSDEFVALYGDSVRDAETLAAIGMGNTVGSIDQEVVQALGENVQLGVISLPEVMLAVTDAPAFVELTSTTPPGG